MIEIPMEDLVFVVCALVGGGLLLITVLLDDILGGIFDFLDISIGGASLMPLLLSFVSMFGVGGLFATQVMDVHGGAAAAVGALFGAAGAAIAVIMFGFLRRSEAADPFSTEDLVGRDAFVAVAIPAGHWGSVYVRAEGQNHELTATASVEVPAGSAVRIVGTAGTGLIVQPAGPAGPASPAAEPTVPSTREPPPGP